MKDQTKIKVIIAENNAIVSEGIALIVNSSPFHEVLFTANDGNELLARLHDQEFDIILMDIEMPNLGGIESTKQVLQVFPDSKIIALSVHESPDYIIQMIESGARAYLSKNDHPRILLQAINQVHAKGYYLTDKTSSALLNKVQEKNRSDIHDTITLSEEEIQTLKLLCLQHSSQEIAEIMCKSTATIGGYRSSLLEKTGSRNIAGLIIFAIKNEYHII